MFVSRSTHVMVIDGASGKVLGDIPDTPRNHGIALVPKHNHGFITSAGDSTVEIFDPDHLQSIGGKAVDLGLRISEQIARERGFPPVRIGVHTGSAVAREGDWYGSGVNVAARLCSAAGGGEVLVSDAARRAAGAPSHIDFGPRRMHWLKNVPEPVAARSAARSEQREPRRPMRELARRVRRPAAGVSIRYSEVTG